MYTSILHTIMIYKVTLSMGQHPTKPFIELVMEECHLEMFGEIRVHRSLTVSLAGPTCNMTLIPRPTFLALTRRETGSHLQFGCEVFT